jgi:DNA-binding transcriptional regulator YdaS (Cro superfamily)
MIKNLLKNTIGTQQSIADALGVNQAAVCQWDSGKKKISPKNAKKIEQLFGIPREQLRPDIYGN